MTLAGPATESQQTALRLVENLRRRFEQAGVASPESDARALVCGMLGIDLTRLVLDTEIRPDAATMRRIADAAERRCSREPVHRILGRRFFYGLELSLSEATLEPRPDTETLVETALRSVLATVERKGHCSILDLGTGTGAIGLALMSKVGAAHVVATDIAGPALETAAANARALGFDDRFRTIRSDWFENVEGVFDVIVSNPPYIRTADIAGLAPEVRLHDPRAALDGGADGLDAYRVVSGEAADYLDSEGRIVVETGFDQHLQIIALFEQSGYVCESREKDLGGNDRVLAFAHV
jgi:release factor glutamine methyltransferase